MLLIVVVCVCVSSELLLFVCYVLTEGHLELVIVQPDGVQVVADRRRLEPSIIITIIVNTYIITITSMITSIIIIVFVMFISIIIIMIITSSISIISYTLVVSSLSLLLLVVVVAVLLAAALAISNYEVLIASRTAEY